MDRYFITKTTHEGANFQIFKAQHNEKYIYVSVKKMKKKFFTWAQVLQLREFKSLRKFNHINIIKLREVIKKNDELFFVFEYLEQNLFQLYQSIKDHGETIPESQIRNIIYQTASGLAYMHKHGFFHRDIKPENLFIKDSTIKLTDFNMTREIRSKPPFTDYVSTRWYRAPEVLLKSTTYNSPIDIFALGCVMAELYILKPLFPGSSEIDQLYKICGILGTPSMTDWPEGYRLATAIGFNFPDYKPVSLTSIIHGASNEAIQLMQEMLNYDPSKRINAPGILKHAYFNSFIPKYGNGGDDQSMNKTSMSGMKQEKD